MSQCSNEFGHFQMIIIKECREGPSLSKWVIKKMVLKYFAILVALAGFQATAASGTDFYVYYLGGQSNMDGYGYVKELTGPLAQPQEHVPIFHGNPSPDGQTVDGRGKWSGLRPGHGVGFQSDGKTNQYSDRFGVELSFAQSIQKAYPKRRIAIIKYSRGGTSIDSEAAGEFGCWEPDFNRGNGINQYDHFLATIRNAHCEADIDGDGQSDRLIPAGILWMQGESDAHYTLEIASRYQANLRRLMDLIRAAFRADDLPVVIGQISYAQKDPPSWKHGELVRKAQADYVAADSKAALVTRTDRYGYSDPWHYDTEGYIDLGKQFAAEVIPLEKPK
ncbi:MAG: sialate O-acetylesterase [Mariniblastus sp.]|nr:sialate O-acetylesterase [Mariniblastus sp.]